MPKNELLLMLLLFGLLHVNAQEENNISLRVAPGILIFSDIENLGLLLTVEPNIKISKNTIIGLRFGVSINSQKFDSSDPSQFNIDGQNDSGAISFAPTYDHYFDEVTYRPYMGLGLGYYLLSTIDVSQIGEREILEGTVKNQLGVLLRTGFELGTTRIGLEYNFIPKADIEIPNGQIIGKVSSDYLGLSIGFTIEGRRS